MIKTFENFDLTNIYKYLDPRNILYKLRKFGIECKYRVSEFDRYVSLFYSTSPIPKEIEIGEPNSVKLYRNGELIYDIYTRWIDNGMYRFGDNFFGVGYDVVLDKINMEYMKRKRDKHSNMDPYGEEEWEDSDDNPNIRIFRTYTDALDEVLRDQILEKNK